MTLMIQIWYCAIDKDPSLLMVVDFSKIISSVMYFSVGSDYTQVLCIHAIST